jgi:alpha-beta hydrolase superfamily lysophospholipase
MEYMRTQTGAISEEAEQRGRPVPLDPNRTKEIALLVLCSDQSPFTELLTTTPNRGTMICAQMTIADKERHEYEGYYHEVFNEIGKERVLADVEAWCVKRENVKRKA